MYYIQFSYEQIAVINKLNRQIKAETGMDIKLSDDDLIQKIDDAMHTIQNEEIILTYENLQRKLKPTSLKTEQVAKAEESSKTLPAEDITSETPAKKKLMYRGAVIEKDDDSVAVNDTKKSGKMTYRGQKF